MKEESQVGQGSQSEHGDELIAQKLLESKESSRKRTLQVVRSQTRVYSELTQFGKTKAINLPSPRWCELILSCNFFLGRKERLSYSLMY